MISRREIINFAGALCLGFYFGCLGIVQWKRSVQLAQYSGNISLGASLVEYQDSFFERNKRYPAITAEIDQSQLRFGDGASSKLIDEMIYFCDSNGRRYLAILGSGSRKVELEGENGTTRYSEWDKDANRQPPD